MSSFNRKPAIFEELDDAMFAQLPPLYRLMDTGEGLDVRIAECEPERCTMNLYAFYRPISRPYGKLPEEDAQ